MTRADPVRPPSLSTPEAALVRVARVYFRRHAEGTPDPAARLDVMLEEAAGLGRIVGAWLAVLDTYAGTTDRPIAIRPPGCPKLALHEQAFLTALRREGEGRSVHAAAALASIMPPAAARLCHGSLSIVARETVARIEGDGKPDAVAVPAVWRHIGASVAVH